MIFVFLFLISLWGWKKILHTNENQKQAGVAILGSHSFLQRAVLSGRPCREDGSTLHLAMWKVSLVTQRRAPGLMLYCTVSVVKFLRTFAQWTPGFHRYRAPHIFL